MNPEIQNVDTGHGNAPAVSILIEVNDLPVTVAKRSMRGAEIKAAAIAQKVPIQANFTLILKRPGQASHTVGDDDEIPVHKALQFSCLPGDDNS